MKATNRKSRTDGMATTPFALFSSLFGNGRREEDAFSASNSETDLEESRSFTILSIDHTNANTDLPSYRVAVRSDGTVLFHGRRNTSTLGNHKFYVSSDTVERLKLIFKANRFSEIDKLPTYFYLPYVSTSFREDIDSYIVSRIDYNEQPQRLIGLRKEAEDLLMISRFVSDKKTTHTITHKQQA